MLWSYLLLVLAIALACLAVSGVAPVALYGTVSVVCLLLFLGSTLSSFQKFGM